MGPIGEIVEECVRVFLDFPNCKVDIAKRDIAPYFKLSRIRPDWERLFGTQLHGWKFDIATDVLVFYLLLPCGRSGSSGTSSSIDREIPKCHTRHAPTDPERNDPCDLPGVMFVGDGIPTEPRIGARWEQSASIGGPGAFLTFESGSVCMEKLEE